MTTKLGYVLLIDDDEPTNFLHQRMLEKHQIASRIEVAWNGEEAIELLRNKPEGANPPDLILLDINMPVMDGWEFLEAYEGLDESQKATIVVVMLTTSINPDDQTRAERLGYVSGYQRKPLTIQMMEEILAKYF
jgi:CheY-like chemotaxis protein